MHSQVYTSTVAQAARFDPYCRFKKIRRCTPLIVGDKFADPDVMRFLGAEISTDYPEPNSQPMYVIFATMRAVLDALQELGYELITAFAAQGYYTWIMTKSAEGLAVGNSSSMINPAKSEQLPKRDTGTSNKPRGSGSSSNDKPSINKSVETDREGPKKEDKGVDSIGVDKGVNTEEKLKGSKERKAGDVNNEEEAKGADSESDLKTSKSERKPRLSESGSEKKQRSSSKSEPNPKSQTTPEPESELEPEPETEKPKAEKKRKASSNEQVESLR